MQKTIRTAMSSERISQEFVEGGATDANPQAIRSLIEIYQERMERMESEMSARGWNLDA